MDKTTCINLSKTHQHDSKKKKSIVWRDGEVQGGTERRDYKKSKETFLYGGYFFLITIMVLLMCIHVKTSNCTI